MIDTDKYFIILIFIYLNGVGRGVLIFRGGGLRYLYIRPGGDGFLKGGGGGGGGGLLLQIKNQLLSAVAMGNNGHLQP